MTIWGVDADRVARLVSEAFHLGREVGVEGWTLLGGARFYGRRHEYLGATLLSECQSKGAEDNVHVVLPGDACAVGVDALLQLLTRLKMWSSRCAVVRLDLAVDSVPFTPLDAYRAVLAGQTVSWVKRGRDGLVMHTWTSSNGPGRATRSMSAVDRHGAAFASTTDEGRHGSSWRQRTRTRTPPRAVFWNGAATTLSWRGSWSGCLREFCDFGAQDGTHGARDVELRPVVGGVRGRPWTGSAKLVVDRRADLSVDRTLNWIDRAVRAEPGDGRRPATGTSVTGCWRRVDRIGQAVAIAAAPGRDPGVPVRVRAWLRTRTWRERSGEPASCSFPGQSPRPGARAGDWTWCAWTAARVLRGWTRAELARQAHVDPGHAE